MLPGCESLVLAAAGAWFPNASALTVMGWILGAMLVALAIGQLLSGLAYARYFRGYRTPPIDPSQWPKAAVFLSLRGADPFLGECLRRVAALDYPRFEVHVVIDSAEDPARAPVEQWRAAHPELPIHVSFLQKRFKTCSMVCSSIYQSMERIDDSVEVVALLNADTVLYPGWLRAMVAPLLNPAIGAVTGNRWYLPSRGCWGSLVRYVWNAAAVAPMHLQELTWTGALTIKRQIFSRPQFLADLKVSSCEDHAILNARRATGLGLVFAPTSMMLNREECDMKGCSNFIRRQLLWTRLYHPSWRSLALHALGSSAVLSAAGVGFVAAVATKAWFPAAVLLGGLAVFFWTTVAMVAILHRVATRRIAAEQGESIPELPRWVVLKLALALPLTQAVHTWVTLTVMFARWVTWRGIRYAVVPHGVRRLNYQPYLQSGTAELSL